MTRPMTLITGASSGIGEALAYRFAEIGESLALTARSLERLDAVAKTIAARTGHVPLVIAADLAQPGAARRIQRAIAEQGGVVRHLINNAGFGVLGDVANLPVEDQLALIDVNCRAVTELTSIFLPEILAGRGGVLNVGSVAGFVPGPGFAVYYASKAFVLSLTRALRAETKDQGIKVCLLCPGPTATEFGARAGVLKPWTTGWLRPMEASRVAKIAVDGYRAGKAVIVPGVRNKIMVALFSVLPARLTAPLVARAQRRRKAVLS